jgi:type 1 fimbria pilin
MSEAKSVLFTAATALLLATSSPAQDFNWQGPLAKGGTIEIKGVNGGIEAVGTGQGGSVEVTAVKKARKSSPDEVEIQVVEHAEGVTICAVYPSRNGDAPNECKPGSHGRMNVRDNDVNVEFKVRVPTGVRFVGRTVNGGIDASALPADAEAYTVNGGVSVKAGGNIRAETVNGGVEAAFGRADWTGQIHLKTVNGGIEVALPGDASAELRAETVNGDIETDFPVSVTGRFSKRRLSGTIGGGGRQLALSTVNGGIEIRKQ